MDVLSGGSHDRDATAQGLTGDDPHRGRDALRQYVCEANKCDHGAMGSWEKLASYAAAALLFYIGWRGLAPEKRKGALRVVLVMVAVIAAGTAVYVGVMVVMTPKWIAKDCDAAYQEIAQSPQATEPTLAREPFLAACHQLPMSAAECTRLSFAAKFPDGCGRYVDTIHAQLPKLDLKIQQRAAR